MILVVIFRLRSHSKIFNKLLTIFWPIMLPYSNHLRVQVMHLLINIFTGSPYWGPFKNYVDKILTIFDYLPTSTWTFFTLNVDKKKHFLTTYPPHLVHVVFERPQYTPRMVELKSIVTSILKYLEGRIM